MIKKTKTYCKGYIRTDIAEIYWKLSTDRKNLPLKAIKNNQNFYREIKINKKVFEFSKTFENLHLENYISILRSNLPDILSCKELIAFAENLNKK